MAEPLDPASRPAPPDGPAGRVAPAPRDPPQAEERQLAEALEANHRLRADLRRSEELVRAIAEAAPGPIFLKGLDGRLLFANAATLRAIGSSPDRALGRTVQELHDPEVAEAMAANDRHVLETGTAETVEEVLPDADGLPRTYLVTKAPFIEADGRIAGLIGVAQDITHRRETEDALRRREILLAESQRVAQVGSWAWHVQTGRLEWSEEMYRIFGIERSAFSGDLAEVVARAIHPEDRAAVELSNRRVLEEGAPSPLEYRICLPDGGVRTVWAEAAALERDAAGRPVRLTGIVKDLTAQKRVEANLRESEERYRGLVEHAPDIIYSFSDRRGGVYYSPRVEDVLGWPAAYLVENPLVWRDSIHPEDAPRVAAAVQAFLAGGAFEIEYRIRDREGRWRWLLDRSIGRRSDDGETVIYGLAKDVTAAKHAEQALRRQDRALRTLTRCNEAVVRAGSERDLLAAVCRHVVEEGGYALCWVGWRGADEASGLVPAAWHRCDAPRRAAPEAGADPAPGAWGPELAVLRSGVPAVRRDLRDAPGALPDPRAPAPRASIALPLALGGATAGVLSIEALDAEAFDDEEQSLLRRLADTLAFGVAARRTDRERALAEAQLRRSREELRALAARLDSVREEEKTRIARDLHDDMGQLLTALRIDLDRVEEHVEALPPTAANGLLLDRVVEASRLVARTVEASRRAVAVLRPAALDQLGLGPALRQECRDFEARTGVACAIELRGTPSGDPDVEIALFRIAQEALTNVARHAAARRVSLVLEEGRGEALLRVADDGRGPPDPALRTRGLGIVGMRERAARIGGELTVAPGPSCGTVVTARIPGRQAGPPEEGR